MERRRGNKNAKSSPLPVDYLRQVNDVFTANFEPGLKILSKMKGADARFEARGNIYPEEVVLAVSLLFKGHLAATTVYASTDFDPKASSPTVPDLLSACVDAAGSLFGTLLSPDNRERLEQVADESLSALENVPFEWAQVEIERFRIHLKIDKANPGLDQLADEWLSKNDPGMKKLQDEEEEEVKNLFVTGPKKPKGPVH